MTGGGAVLIEMEWMGECEKETENGKSERERQQTV